MCISPRLRKHACAGFRTSCKPEGIWGHRISCQHPPPPPSMLIHQVSEELSPILRSRKQLPLPPTVSLATWLCHNLPHPPNADQSLVQRPDYLRSSAPLEGQVWLAATLGSEAIITNVCACAFYLTSALVFSTCTPPCTPTPAILWWGKPQALLMNSANTWHSRPHASHYYVP